MEEFKIMIWKEDNINIRYRSLDQAEIQKLLDDISDKLNIKIYCDSFLFTKLSEILMDQVLLLNINEPDGFECFISKFNLHIPGNIPVNVIWNYDSVDCFEIDELKKFWEYIWYGASDEMCLLYFQEINFIIMLTDYGTMYYNRLCKF
ncbi:hypothetical protein [Bacteroides sedimenti]|uniref:Uncharacterized protein n=1 Tax=Bacteroides sedimenti TaxID=2136147 RepID=A0ABM8IDE2_9BACE